MSSFRHLSDEQVRRVYAAAIDAGLARDVDALFSGLPRAYAARLPSSGSAAARLLMALHEINAVARLNDGTVPLQVVLRRAEELTAGTPWRADFEASRNAMGTASSSDAEVGRAAAGGSRSLAVDPATPAVDVIILTALSLEYRAVLGVGGSEAGGDWQRLSSTSGLPLAMREFVGADGRRLRILAAQAGDMGGIAVVTALQPLLQTYRPRCIAMTGVCAGRPGKTSLGDVIAAERLFYHDAGKERADAILRDIQTYNLRKDWKVALEHFDFAGRFRGEPWLANRPIPYEWQENWILFRVRGGDANPAGHPDCVKLCPQFHRAIEHLWERDEIQDGTLEITPKGKARIGRVLIKHGNRFPDLPTLQATLPFRVHVAPMGSGSRVMEDSAIWGVVEQTMRTTLGIEMEAAALGMIADGADGAKLDALVMKGVMDFANEGRNDHFKEFAARASAECLIAFLREQMAGAPVRAGVAEPPAREARRPSADDHAPAEAGARSHRPSPDRPPPTTERWPKTDAVRVFIVRDPADDSARARLTTHLATLVRNGTIALRHTGDIEAGEDLTREIDSYLVRAEVVLLLITPYFVDSDECTRQWKRALELKEERGIRVIPVLVKRAHIRGLEFERFAALPAGGKEVSAWSNADDAWYDVVTGIRRVVEGMRSPR